MRKSSVHFRTPPRRGAIFIIALAVIIVLSGLVLVFAQEMRTEATTSSNRLAYVQADAIERGAEQWVLAQIESNTTPGDAVTLTQLDPAPEAIQIGNLEHGGGYFWILTPSATAEDQYAFGITDEAGKINLNAAGSSSFINLPGMTSDIATAIMDWQGLSGSNAASASYYQSLPEPYTMKTAPFESVDELLLIKGMTPLILYGNDSNHNGVFDPGESSNAGPGAALTSGIGSANDPLGLFNYVTCFSAPPPVPVQGSGTPARVNVSQVGLPGLQTLLQKIPSKGQTIFDSVRTGVYYSLSAFYQRAGNGGMRASDYGLIADQLTSNANLNLLNVNTASLPALSALPGLTQSDAQTVINARTNADLTSMAWFFTALNSETKAASVADYVTDKSYLYSADIVATSRNGTFKRVRIVVNCTASPAQIVYRKDLTALGWPLPEEIRDDMRRGLPPSDSSGNDGPGLGGSGLNLGTTPK